MESERLSDAAVATLQESVANCRCGRRYRQIGIVDLHVACHAHWAADLLREHGIQPCIDVAVAQRVTALEGR